MHHPLTVHHPQTGGNAPATPAVMTPFEAAAARLRAAVTAATSSGASPEKATAFALVKELYGQWKAPVETLGRAGRAFEGLEALLGADGFDLEVRWGPYGSVLLDGMHQLTTGACGCSYPERPLLSHRC